MQPTAQIEWKPLLILLSGGSSLRGHRRHSLAYELLIGGRPLRLIGTADSETQTIKMLNAQRLMIKIPVPRG